MKTKLSILLGSLLGACAVHMVLTACGGAHSSSTPDASADTTCSSWQTGFVIQTPTIPGDILSSSPTLPTNQVLGIQTVPGGWEPTETQVVGSGSGSTATVLVHVRKCASP